MTTKAGRLIAAIVMSLLLGACSSTPSANTSGNGGTTSGQCSEPCVLFHVQINFSGLDPVQGEFVDNSSGSGDASCTDWAKGDSVGWVLGPGTPAGKATTIAGKVVNFGLSIGKDKFHGPGTYSDTLLDGITIDQDTFLGNTSSETLNADGSGQLTFSNIEGGSVTGPQGTESGTVTWTCSKG